MDAKTTKVLRGLVDKGTAEKVAARLGVDPQTLARWLAGLSQPSALAQERIDALLAEEANK